MHVCTAVTC